VPLLYDTRLTIAFSAFKEVAGTGNWGRFLGFWSTMINATFAYLGTELVGVTVAEAQNPRKTIPKASTYCTDIPSFSSSP
jgi:amino acid permease